MRKKNNGPDGARISEETAVNLGYYYSSVEAHLKSLSAQTGGADSLANIAHRLAQLLEATALREQHGNPAMVSEMWPDGDSARARVRAAFNNGFATGQADVGPHGHRTLNAKARKAISKAQRERWAKFHAKQAQSGPGRGHRTPAQIKRMAVGIKSYWAKMTPEERAREVLRRRKVSEAKKRGAA